MSTNEHTGQAQQTKPATDAYRQGWDAIFGEKVEIIDQISPQEEAYFKAVTDANLAEFGPPDLSVLDGIFEAYNKN